MNKIQCFILRIGCFTVGWLVSNAFFTHSPIPIALIQGVLFGTIYASVMELLLGHED